MAEIDKVQVGGTSYDITNTKNTAGTTNKTGTKMFLAGATEQSANPQTYSNSNVYIGTDNCLYSGGTKVLTSHQDISGKVSGPSSATNNAVAIFDGTGGKAIKNSGFTIGKSVPSDAVFTDTTYSQISRGSNAGLAPGLPSGSGTTKYLREDGSWQVPPDTNTWRGIQDNLTSTSTTDSLSAAQGKVLNDKLAKQSNASVYVYGTLSDLKAGLLTIANGMSAQDVQRICFVTNFADDVFQNGNYYVGDIHINTKGITWNYFSVLVQGMLGNDVISITNFNESWIIDKLALNSKLSKVAHTTPIIATTLSDLKTNLFNAIDGVDSEDMLAVKIFAEFTSDGFVTGATYGGYAYNIYKPSGTTLYFSVILSNNIGEDMLIGYSNGVWYFNSLSSKLSPVTILAYNETRLVDSTNYEISFGEYAGKIKTVYIMWYTDNVYETNLLIAPYDMRLITSKDRTHEIILRELGFTDSSNSIVVNKLGTYTGDVHLAKVIAELK